MSPEASFASLASHVEHPSPSFQGLRFIPHHDTTASGINNLGSDLDCTLVDSESGQGSQQTTIDVPTSKYRNASVITLHIALLAIHGLLLVALVMRLESKVVMSLTEGSGVVSTVITIAPQIFINVCKYFLYAIMTSY
jgi:hypothetical protein